MAHLGHATTSDLSPLSPICDIIAQFSL